MNRRAIVGSRGSKLALIQTRSVIAQIREINPDVTIDIREITTTGDRDHRTKLDKIGVAAFVKELELALLDYSIDLAIPDRPTLEQLLEDHR